MPVAYVLINCETGYEDRVIGELCGIDGVVEVNGVYGAYDIVAKAQSDSMDKLKETITWKIRRVSKVKSTLTLVKIEGQE